MRAYVVAAALALTGCMDVEFGAEVISTKEVVMTRVLQIDRRAWDMQAMAQTCEGHEVTIGRDSVRCDFDTTFQTSRPDSGPKDTRFAVEGDAVRVTFPTGVRVAEFSEGLAERIPPGDVAEAALVGRSVVWKISGAEILDASVPFQPGATFVEFVVPVMQIRDAPQDVAPEFWALVRPK